MSAFHQVPSPITVAIVLVCLGGDPRCGSPGRLAAHPPPRVDASTPGTTTSRAGSRGERTDGPERRRGRRHVARRDHRRHGASPPSVAIALSLWRRSFVPRDLRRRCSSPGSAASTGWRRQLISRDRPPVRILDPGLVPDHSFPSGHVATATRGVRRHGRAAVGAGARGCGGGCGCCSCCRRSWRSPGSTRARTTSPTCWRACVYTTAWLAVLVERPAGAGPAGQ